MATMEWLHANGYLWGEEIVQFAAISGDTTIVQWLRARGCPWQKGACDNAVTFNHLEMLQWLRGNGCPWDRTRCLARAKSDAVRAWINNN